MVADPRQDAVDYDVVIIGAGISGLSFAYRLQERNPDLTYCILDGRHEIGGTWSLFQYPGIRSDSDLFTFGFPWHPWTEKETIAQGPLISRYLKDAASKEGIDKKIKFHHQITRIAWSTATKTWTLAVTVNDTDSITLRTRFLLMGTGYYDYREPLKTEIPGISDFQGTVVHPQFWPRDLDCQDKNVVIIGSGATAITLLPAIAQTAAHVTMLQRSPSYVLSVPGEDGIEKAIRMVCPTALAKKLIRIKWIVFPFLMVSFCQWFPRTARNLFRKATASQLPPEMALDPNFDPKYNPFEQRMCMSPNGDFYAALRSGKASVVTGVIDAVTADGIRLQSGHTLHPDIIVTATGLKLHVGGGIAIEVDGQPFHVPSHFTWKGAMFEDLPNLVFAFGYVDQSWTLGADASAQLACRLLKQMRKEGAAMIVPRRSADEKQHMKELPFLYLTSTYVERGKAVLPKVGDRPQWRPRSYYLKDLLNAWWGDIKTGLQWV